MSEFWIIGLYISQAEILNHWKEEQFDSYDTAKSCLDQNYKDEGWFWTDRYEYRIIEIIDRRLVKVYDQHQVYVDYIQKHLQDVIRWSNHPNRTKTGEEE